MYIISSCVFSETKPFQCSKCSQQFTQKHHLQVHEELHSGKSIKYYILQSAATTMSKILFLVISVYRKTPNKGPFQQVFYDSRKYQDSQASQNFLQLAQRSLRTFPLFVSHFMLNMICEYHEYQSILVPLDILSENPKRLSSRHFQKSSDMTKVTSRFREAWILVYIDTCKMNITLYYMCQFVGCDAASAEGQPLFVCTMCGLTFSTKMKLHKHTTTVHTGIVL